MTVNEVTFEGLVTQSLDEIISNLQNAFRSIYGSDINVDSNSPDGQMIGILAQLKADLLDLGTQVYNSFDPDVAQGSALDSRVAMNGIQRIGGTYTVAPVAITVDRALTLYGLDQNVETVFTVADTSGNQFQLVSTNAFAVPGTATLNFQAVEVGAVDVSVNTITAQVTVVIGVTVVNNPAPVGVVGQDEETDADLRLRRQASLAIGSTNSLDSLRAALANLDAVTDSYVWENYTRVADAYGVPGNTIWAIVEGGAAADIGAAIYAKRSAGCGMFGSEAVDVTQPNGDIFEVAYDLPEYVPIYIHFTLTPRFPTASYDAATVKAALVAGLDYKLFDPADAAAVTTLLATIVPSFIPSICEVSDDGFTWVEILTPTDPQHKFTIDVANITIS